MASYNSYIGDGSQDKYAITFPFIEQDHVKVFLDGVHTAAWTWFDPATIEFTIAPLLGAVIFIQRVTPVDERLAEFTNGEALLDTELNIAVMQALYASEEAKDRAEQSIVINTGTGHYDFGGRRATNLADPTDNQDAATKGWTQALYATVVSSLTTARDATFAARDTVLGYLNTVYDYMVTTLGYKNEAGDSAASAHTSEVNAAQSAASAENIAASLHPENFLTKAGNLADVANADDSLTNLGATTVGRSLVKSVDAEAGRDALGLKSAATKDVGTGANNVVQLDGSGNIPSALKASTSEAKAGVDANKIMTSARVNEAILASISTAFAWVNFYGGPSEVAIRASFNVSSITDYGTGDWGVNHTNAAADGDYAAIATVGEYGGTLSNRSVSASVISASVCRILCSVSNTASQVDATQVNYVAFR